MGVLAKNGVGFEQRIGCMILRQLQPLFGATN
jgi:hypothetical protein